MAHSELIRHAQELKARGMSTYQIADELKVQPDTVVWLLLRGKERAAQPPPGDVFVDWKSIGSNAKRIGSVAAALANLTTELVHHRTFSEPEVVAAIEGSGMVLGIAVAHELNKPFAGVRPHRAGEGKITGMVNPSFAKVEGRKTLIVDAVLRAGETHKAAVESLRQNKAKPVAIIVLVNKSGKSSIDGIPLRALIELQPLAE
jgi:orotate phosphoribosyltransferase